MHSSHTATTTFTTADSYDIQAQLAGLQDMAHEDAVEARYEAEQQSDYSPDIHDQMAAEQAMAMQDATDRRHAEPVAGDTVLWLHGTELRRGVVLSIDRKDRARIRSTNGLNYFLPMHMLMCC